MSLWTSLLRIGFHLLYNQLAWTYDAVSWVVSLGAWRDWQLAAVPFLSGPRVLELAHGPGHMLVVLAGQGYDVVGLDLSPYMSRQARRRLQRAGVDAPLLHGRAQDLPFAPDQFDGVLSTFPTEFIVDPETLAAVAAVLKPGGRFVIVPEGHLDGRGAVSRFIEWLYTITGQRDGTFAGAEDGSWPETSRWQLFEERFAAAGFGFDIHDVPLSSSHVTIVVAVRQ